VVPSTAPNPTRLPFLSLGLALFVPKLAATDARLLMEQLDQVVAVINEEDELYAPLFEFVNRIAARARGASGHSSVLPKKRRGGGKSAQDRHAANHETAENKRHRDGWKKGGSETSPLNLPTGGTTEDSPAADMQMRIYGRRRR
jgi:hypothetical protein